MERSWIVFELLCVPCISLEFVWKSVLETCSVLFYSTILLACYTRTSAPVNLQCSTESNSKSHCFILSSTVVKSMFIWMMMLGFFWSTGFLANSFVLMRNYRFIWYVNDTVWTNKFVKLQKVPSLHSIQQITLFAKSIKEVHSLLICFSHGSWTNSVSPSCLMVGSGIS